MNMAETRNAVRYFYAVLISTFVSLLIFALVTVVIDPFFHYHAPLDGLAYPIYNERYQNDGISRNFDYDAIITGTSMTQNFKTSELDELFHVSSVKLPFAGAYYHEIDSGLNRAFSSDNAICLVLRGLDYNALIIDKDEVKYDVEYPTYLTNDNFFDDVYYILNKTVFFDNSLNCLSYTRAGNRTTTFDEYNNWNSQYVFGKEAVLASYSIGEKVDTEQALTEEDFKTLRENIRQNVTELIAVHPDTTFYLFFTPYSICYWDSLYHSGLISRQLAAEQYVIEELLQYPNVKLYSFFNNYAMICNLDNYKDYVHYGEWVNSWILEWMRADQYLLTKENYLDYLEANKEFYLTYDYESLHKGE